MKTYTVELNAQELSILNEALIALPYKFAAPVIASISKQIEVPPLPTEDETELAEAYFGTKK